MSSTFRPSKFQLNATYLILVLLTPQATPAGLLDTGRSNLTLTEDRERRAPQEAVPEDGGLVRELGRAQGRWAGHRALQMDREVQFNQQMHRRRLVAMEAAAAKYGPTLQAAGMLGPAAAAFAAAAEASEVSAYWERVARKHERAALEERVQKLEEHVRKLQELGFLPDTKINCAPSFCNCVDLHF